MILHVVGTGSSGNCYILESSNGDSLIIDAGCKFSEVKKALDFNIEKIKGLIVTHEHLDHAKYIKEFSQAGIKVYSNEQTIQKANLLSSQSVIIEHKKQFNIGGFKIIPLNAVHDVPCFMFLIEHVESGKIMFMTDSIYSPYVFSGINNFIIEANYSREILNKKINGGYNPYLRDRVIRSHQSLETCLETLKANDLSKTYNIVLIHLSDSNSDEKMFQKIVQKETLVNTTIANSGLKINFNNDPF